MMLRLAASSSVGPVRTVQMDNLSAFGCARTSSTKPTTTPGRKDDVAAFVDSLRPCARSRGEVKRGSMDLVRRRGNDVDVQ